MTMKAIEAYRGLGSAAALVGEQRLLFIFVDDAGAEPWTSALRRPVEERIDCGLRWLQEQAEQLGICLHIRFTCVPHAGKPPLTAGVRITEAVLCAEHHFPWQNGVVGQLADLGTVAGLWDELFEICGLPLATGDGSGVLFCVRRGNCCSVAFPLSAGRASTESVKERAIIYDNGGEPGVQLYLDSEVAHEVLHLYGAVDLRPATPTGAMLLAYAASHTADIMHTPNKLPLARYEVGDLTRYLVGWDSSRPACLL